MSEGSAKERPRLKITSFALDEDFYLALRDYADSAHTDMKRVIQAATWDFMKHTRPKKFCAADSVPNSTEVLK